MCLLEASGFQRSLTKGFPKQLPPPESGRGLTSSLSPYFHPQSPQITLLPLHETKMPDALNFLPHIWESALQSNGGKSTDHQNCLPHLLTIQTWPPIFHLPTDPQTESKQLHVPLENCWWESSIILAITEHLLSATCCPKCSVHIAMFNYSVIQWGECHHYHYYPHFTERYGAESGKGFA